MISIGVVQTKNSTDIESNFKSISTFLSHFEGAPVDLVVFPECSLSGFSSQMKACIHDRLSPYLNAIQAWTARTGVEVVLPSAVAENDKIYNSGFWFKNESVQRFYKVGLTDSEKKFFSPPEISSKRIFRVRDFNLALLICIEAEHAPWSYFEKGDVDAILWPAYWGWKLNETWSEEKEPGRSNTVYSNASQWQVPIIQSNFARNNLADHSGSGPEGLSVVIDEQNNLGLCGPHLA